jgi:hypothetical protein
MTTFPELEEAFTLPGDLTVMWCLPFDSPAVS